MSEAWKIVLAVVLALVVIAGEAWLAVRYQDKLCDWVLGIQKWIQRGATIQRLKEEISVLADVVDRDMDDFVDLNEYWNGGNGAAVDACQHCCEVSEIAIKRHKKLRADKREALAKSAQIKEAS